MNVRAGVNRMTQGSSPADDNYRANDCEWVRAKQWVALLLGRLGDGAVVFVGDRERILLSEYSRRYSVATDCTT